MNLSDKYQVILYYPDENSIGHKTLIERFEIAENGVLYVFDGKGVLKKAFSPCHWLRIERV